jgi:hypothetical protein
VDVARRPSRAQALAEIASVSGKHDLAAVEPNPQRLVSWRVAVGR